MAETKYLKFGLRADRNLTDLTNAKNALDNILDNISNITDEEGNKLNFTADDLLPLVGIADGPLGLNQTDDGLSADFADLANTTAEATSPSDASTKVAVEPRITIQDHINNFKVTLGDPPWTNGGTGPIATMVPSDRLNRNVFQYADSGEDNYAIFSAQFALPEQLLRILPPTSTNLTFDQLQAAINFVTGDIGGTKRINDPETNGGKVFAVDAIDAYYVVVDTGDNSFDFSTVGASASTPPIGEVFKSTAIATWTAAQGHVIKAKNLGNLTQGKKYTILSLGTGTGGLSSSRSEWTLAGASKPFVGMIFECNQAPASQGSVTDAWAIEHWHIGDVFVCTSPGGQEGQYSTTNIQHTSLEAHTVPNGDGLTNVDPENLPTNKWYTSKIDPSKINIQYNQDFWTDGDVSLQGKLHPEFRDQFGGVQWEGYQSSIFDFDFNTNAFFTFEEDLVEDGTDNNWELIKGNCQYVIKNAYPISLETNDAGVTRATIQKFEYQRICVGHKVNIQGQDHEIVRVGRTYLAGPRDYAYYFDLGEDIGITSDNNYFEFNYDRSEGELNTGRMDLTPPARNKRRRIRYTAWWIEPVDPDDITQLADVKIHEEDEDSSLPLASNRFYPQQAGVGTLNVYGYEYFDQNRLNKLKQDSTAKLAVDAPLTFALFTPKQSADDHFPAHPNSATTHLRKINVSITENSGAMEVDPVDGPIDAFEDAKEGDWIIAVSGFTTDWSNGNSNAYCVQITEKVNDNKIYVDPTYKTYMNLALNDVHQIIILENEGFVGAFEATRTGDNSMTLYRMPQSGDSLSRRPEEITTDDMVYYVGFTGSTNRSTYAVPSAPSKVQSVGSYSPSIGANQVSVTVDKHPNLDAATDTLTSGNVSTLDSANGIAIVYASRGLNDISGQFECRGVYGVEVAVEATGGANNIQLVDASNVSVGDTVYYEAAIDQYWSTAHDATESGTGSTTVTQISSNTITLSRPVQSGKTIIQGATLVGVPTTYGSASDIRRNREYCIIPLNTAPPFVSSGKGLATVNDYPNFIAKEIIYKKLSLDTLADVAFKNPTLGSGGKIVPPAVSAKRLDTDYFFVVSGTPSGATITPYNVGVPTENIYKVLSVSGTNNSEATLGYWNGSSWVAITITGSVGDEFTGLTFTGYGRVKPLELFRFEGTSEQEGTETGRVAAQQSDQYFPVTYTSGNTTRTFRLLSSTRDLKAIKEIGNI